MTIEQMRERKRELGYSYQKIAQLSGLPVGTVQKVLGGITRSPREETIWALEAVLKPMIPVIDGSDWDQDLERRRELDPRLNLGRGDHLISKDGWSDRIGEPAAGYGAGVRRAKRQGEYTVEDYYALPDDVRVELIDGVIYDMATPTTTHQILSMEIGLQISQYIKDKKGKCVSLLAPLDVQLDCDDRSVVQPDLLVVCDRDKVHKRMIYGAPDLVVEVLAAATRRKDMSIKLAKYTEAGVREYWMVDPDKKKILVYLLEGDDLPTIYGFRDQVPVGVFGGELCVDFAQIEEYLSGL